MPSSSLRCELGELYLKPSVALHFNSRWRVLEISDIILIIVDIRNPVLHFPPSLYNYVVHEMGRKLVVVFNKVPS